MVGEFISNLHFENFAILFEYFFHQIGFMKFLSTIVIFYIVVNYTNQFSVLYLIKF